MPIDLPRLYARPGGTHFHGDKNCPMLADGQFEQMGYREISLSEISFRNLGICLCAQNLFSYYPKKKGFKCDSPTRQANAAATQPGETKSKD